MINTCLVGGGAIMVIIYVDKLIKVSRQQRCNTANIFCPPFLFVFQILYGHWTAYLTRNIYYGKRKLFGFMNKQKQSNTKAQHQTHKA